MKLLPPRTGIAFFISKHTLVLQFFHHPKSRSGRCFCNKWKVKLRKWPFLHAGTDKSHGFLKPVLWDNEGQLIFWGENREMLGWYADEESVQKETADILAAIETGKPSYNLKYAAKVKKRFLSVELVKEERKEQAT